MQKNPVTGHGNAKINLCMDVLDKREDGYHSVRSVMQSIALGDLVTLKWTQGSGVRFSSNVPYLPTGDRNNAVKAAKLFFKAIDREQDIEHSKLVIRCIKKIPVCGGLGGSSADAAIVLKLLNREYGNPFTVGMLCHLSEPLGSDVPFCVAGGAALAEGTGLTLTLLPPMPHCGIVIVKPEFTGVSAELYAAIDNIKIKTRPDTEGLISALKAVDLRGIAYRMFNVFEEALPLSQVRIVNELKGRLLDFGALGTSMSGSGSAVFGVFADMNSAKNAYLTLRKDNIECYLTMPQG